MSENSSHKLLDDDLLQQINTWCGVHGLMYSDGDIKWNAAPLSLTPLPYPADAFHYLQEIQTTWNFLMDKIARNREFILSELREVATSDAEFTGRLLTLYKALPQETVKHSWTLGIFRSDYMLHNDHNHTTPENHWKPLQVEINTIASGLGCLTTKANSFQREFLLRHISHPQVHNIYEQQETCPVDSTTKSCTHKTTSQFIRQIAQQLQISPSLSKIASVMAQAHRVYLQHLHVSEESDGYLLNEDKEELNDRIRILFVCQPREKNVGDQRALEQELWQAHRVRCEFATFAELTFPHLFLSYKNETIERSADKTINNHHIDDKRAPKLFFQRHEKASCFEVSLVYFRAGYTPTDYLESFETVNNAINIHIHNNDENEHMRHFHRLYDSEKNAHWRVRCLIEFSRAIKCPSVGLHLAGVKAIQAALTRPDVLETLLLSSAMSSQEKSLWTNKIDALRMSFAEQHLLSFTLSNDSTDASSVSSMTAVQQQAAKDAVDDACETDGQKWVLKPQREGGGNNLYGDTLATYLRAHRDDGILQGYVLMRRFQPPVQSHTVFYKFGQASIGAAVSELGIFGSYLGHGSDMTETSVGEENGGYVGYLLRTKGAEVDEGGVATGFSVLNSLYLV